ncbi:MAG TPA: M48 family metalloprotease [Candidatus Brocadiia bacterium]|nr:M48 family metalloprotease [Candidatus Brocadiia bacterium]
MKQINRLLQIGVIVTVAAALGCESAGKSLKGVGDLADQGADQIGDSKLKSQIKAGAKVAKSGGEWMAGIDLPKELALGQTFTVRVVEDYGAKPDPLAPDSVQRYVNLVGYVVAKQSTRPNLTFYFVVIKNDTPNAFACPGGFIVVTTAMLKQLQNEAELAGVLGHEIAHVCYKHGLNVVSRNEAMSSAMDFASQWDDTAKFNGFIDQAYENLILNRYDQKDEFQSDESGSLWAYRAGYCATGLHDALKLRTSHGEAKFFSTHPNVDERISKLAAQAKSQPSGDKLPKMSNRYKTEVLDKL